MGSANSKKPEITIRAIRSSTEDIRSSLRRKQVPLQNKEELHQTLINNSKQLNTLRSKGPKKKQLEIDQIQKLVRDVNEELLEYNDDQLDKGADESHSFIHVNPARIKSQKITPKVSKGRSNSRGIFPVTKLNEIEHQFSKVKNDVIVGIKNRDNQSLLLQKNKIEMLQTDLELLNITQSSTLFEKKENLERELYRYYQKL
ncbi:hypothetical protein HHI36_015133 [Cryptolaemus montrouzieri]|uniref:Uncharacterized protein n=1 Tax=Cryptolaemus montrouzieri TaxID=559131 RepID=A0ABD2N4Q2_9CUCU